MNHVPSPSDHQHEAKPASELVLRLTRSLPAEVYAWLAQVIDATRAHGRSIYLVGGPVRDLLLRRAITDLDFVVEGDAWPVARTFAEQVGGNLTQHAAFRTAAVELQQNGTPFVIDFVTARREIYPAPAALPVVEPSHILDDLHRRDFTINTLALRLDSPQPLLLDPYAGQSDLAARLIRVLHDRSFVDDPTRILRAARFAARLQFTVEPHTRALIEAALAERMLERTSAQRILNELWLLLEEPAPLQALYLLHELRALPQLGLVWSDTWPQLFAAAQSTDLGDAALPDVLFGLLVWPLDPVQRQALTEHYNLPAAKRKLIDELSCPLPMSVSQPDVHPAELEQLLQPYSPAALRVLQLTKPELSDQLTYYLDRLKTLPPMLSGTDLQELGIPPGPIYRQILSTLRAAQLSGAVRTREAALRWIRDKYG